MRADIPPLPNMPSWRGAQLKLRDNFNFYLAYMRDEMCHKTCKFGAISALRSPSCSSSGTITFLDQDVPGYVYEIYL